MLSPSRIPLQSIASSPCGQQSPSSPSSPVSRRSTSLSVATPQQLLSPSRVPLQSIASSPCGRSVSPPQSQGEPSCPLEVNGTGEKPLQPEIPGCYRVDLESSDSETLPQ